MNFVHEEPPPEAQSQTGERDYRPQVGQNWPHAVRLEMNAYLLNHPGLPLESWFEGQISKWGKHPMAAN
jgi:hypothetical protein